MKYGAYGTIIEEKWMQMMPIPDRLVALIDIETEDGGTEPGDFEEFGGANACLVWARRRYDAGTVDELCLYLMDANGCGELTTDFKLVSREFWEARHG